MGAVTMAGGWPAGLGTSWGTSWGRAWGGAWGQTGAVAASQEVDVALDSSQAHTTAAQRRWYVRRGRQILLFDTGADADAWLAAQARAELAVQEAQKTSRRARKRLRARFTVNATPPVQTIELGALAAATRKLELPVHLGALLERQDWQAVAHVHELARVQLALQAQQDEEEVALLLLA